MWLTSSSIGRKLVMAITGVCLILFVTFHCMMNGVALFWPSAYNAICAFLGANWYALIASIGLAALFVIHIIYAVWLTVQNRKARGADRYDVTSSPKEVEWSSKNMLVLGIVILAFLIVHLIQFWAKMQLAEILGCPAEYNGSTVAPQSGTMFLQIAFSQWWTPVVYIIGFVALWFHMNHGFWSMFQTAGWNNGIWMNRIKTIGCWWTTIVVALFVAQAITFTVQAQRGTYETCPELQAQYDMFTTELIEKGIPVSICGEATECDGNHADCDKHQGHQGHKGHGSDCDKQGHQGHKGHGGDCDKQGHKGHGDCEGDKAACDGHGHGEAARGEQPDCATCEKAGTPDCDNCISKSN